MISGKFGSDYVKVGIPEKWTIYYLGIVCNPTPDKEVGTQQISFFKIMVALKNNFSETLILAEEASENTDQRFCF